MFGYKRRNLKLATALLIMQGAAIGSAWAGKADDTLVWARDQEVNILDTYYSNTHSNLMIMDEVCDGLLAADPKTLEAKPNLASSFKWVDDTTLELELRRGVKFHGGKAFSAEDVKYTLDHISHPDSGVVQRALVDWIDSTQIVDEYKVRIKAKKPTPVAIEYLAGMIFMLPKGHYDKAVERNGRKDYASVPLDCTGPYRVTNFKPGDTIDFEAFRDYHASFKPKASISKLHYRTIRDSDSQIVELMGGGVDWIWNVRKDKAERLKGMGQVGVMETPIQRFSYITFNSSGKGGGENPFRDIRVRQAVAHAINAKPISKNLVGGSSEPIYSACHPAQFGCFTDVKKYEYNPDKSRALLKEAGKEKINIDLFTFSNPNLAEPIINDLRAVGITANMRLIQYNALRPMMRAGDTKIASLTWGSNSLNDATAATSYFFTGTDDDMTHDAEVKSYLDIADTSIDPQVRKENFAKAQKLIAERAYWVPLYTMVMYYGISPNLAIQPYFDDKPRFYRASWK